MTTSPSPLLRRAAIVGVAVAAAFAVSAPSASAGATATGPGCGTVSRDYPGGNGGSSVRITFAGGRPGLSCVAARRIVARCIVSRRVPGWRAAGNLAGTFSLIRGRQRINLVGLAGGPPRCTAGIALTG
jgi:hypothetical protein